MSREPGAIRRAAYGLYRAFPPKVGYRLVRAVQPTYALGAIALIEFDGKVLALKQLHRSGFSLPGGLVDRGEQPHEAVRREVFEETGLQIDPGDPITVTFDTDVNHVDIIFRIVCESEPQVKVASEAYAHTWHSLDHWPEADYATARILRAVRAAAAAPKIGRLLPQ